MIKKIKKLSIILILIMLTLVLKGSSVFAIKTTQEYFEDFKNEVYESTYNLYVGELMQPIRGGVYYNLLDDENVSIDVNIENSNVIAKHRDNDDILKAKKVGESKVTISVTYNGITEIKTINIKVKETSTSKKLDSKVNDVIDIVTSANNKTEVLLENSELWKVDTKSNKLSKKISGNVKDYSYTRVFYRELYKTNEEGNVYVEQKLKNNDVLYVKNAKKEIKIKDVKQINDYGFLKNNGTYYIYTIDNNKFSYRKTITGVDSLIGEFLCIKDGKTYSLYDNKILNTEIKQACKYTSGFDYGIVLNKKGEIWEYLYDYDKDNGTYKTTKLKNKAKELIDSNNYKTTSGELKNIFEKEDTKNIYKEVYPLASVLNGNYSNMFGLKLDGKVYLNDVAILDKVERIYSPSFSYLANIGLIVRKDGSIWKLELAGKASLTKIRSGKESAKKISKPTNVKTAKSGSKNIKISWKKVDGASKYTLYRATSKNGSYKKIGTTKSSSYTDKKATVGKTYYYKMVANHSNSDYSSSRTLAVKMKIPKAPTSLNVSKKSKTSMKVSYKKSSGVTGYEIKYSTSKNFKNSKTKEIKGTSFTIKNLKKNKKYYVKVRAYQTIDGKKVYSSYTKTVRV